MLSEWLRRPRLRVEVEAQKAPFPRATAVPFGRREAVLADGAALWTLNPEDFRDIPNLSLL